MWKWSINRFLFLSCFVFAEIDCSGSSHQISYQSPPRKLLHRNDRLNFIGIGEPSESAASQQTTESAVSQLYSARYITVASHARFAGSLLYAKVNESTTRYTGYNAAHIGPFAFFLPNTIHSPNCIKRCRVGHATLNATIEQTVAATT